MTTIESLPEQSRLAMYISNSTIANSLQCTLCRASALLNPCWSNALQTL